MAEWKKCRKKPIVVHFREVEGEEEVIQSIDKESRPLIAVAKDDFIMKGVKGELYPIKKKIFYETYDVIEE